MFTIVKTEGYHQYPIYPLSKEFLIVFSKNIDFVFTFFICTYFHLLLPNTTSTTTITTWDHHGVPGGDLHENQGLYQFLKVRNTTNTTATATTTTTTTSTTTTTTTEEHRRVPGGGPCENPLVSIRTGRCWA